MESGGPLINCGAFSEDLSWSLRLFTEQDIDLCRLILSLWEPNLKAAWLVHRNRNISERMCSMSTGSGVPLPSLPPPVTVLWSQRPDRNWMKITVSRSPDEGQRTWLSCIHLQPHMGHPCTGSLLPSPLTGVPGRTGQVDRPSTSACCCRASISVENS